MLAISGLERKNGVFFGENLDGGDLKSLQKPATWQYEHHVRRHD
jgi:hypothetical protein